MHGERPRRRVRHNVVVTESTPPPSREPQAQRDQVTVRRAPKVGAFMIVGGALGFFITLLATTLTPQNPESGASLAELVGYFSLFGITFGVTAGALLALGFEWRSRRRARVLEAEREIVDPDPVEGVIDDEPTESAQQP